MPVMNISTLMISTTTMMSILVFAAVIFSILEKKFPNQQDLPKVPGWWIRSTISYLFRLILVLVFSYWYYATPALKDIHLFNLQPFLTPFVGGILGYLGTTFVDYWTHRFRHDNYFLWLSVHQFHHAPSRIQTITSFYKHPLENILEVFFTAFVSVTILGLDPIGAAWAQFWVILINLFYHTNIKTPQWLGYFIQRPEMHLIHHARSVQYYNFADLPTWDILFGTFRNPEPPYPGPCGFANLAELKVGPILLCEEVDPDLVAKKYRGQNRSIP
ncbi:MAG: sterol desaturase family protein [Legionellaceae bacterium]|nr:sterol desaturase family protein [Legionellaceae bacterium]